MVKSSQGGKTALDLYIEEIKQIDPLPATEEVRLAQLSKKGDQEAFDKLITHNLRFVVAVAKKFQHHSIPLEDLINEGNLGLIKAVHKFDETRGFKFISYAVWWISQSIRQAISKTGRTIRLPSNVTESMGKLYKRSLELEQVYEREPTSEELAEISDTTILWIENLIQSATDSVSLDDPVGDSETTLKDFLSSEDNRPEMQTMKESLEAEIRNALQSLNEQEQTVLLNYFGLSGSESKNLEEIGSDLGVTGERIRQIKERALQRLRHNTNSKLLLLYLS
ncbi:MAG: sigma-70 family RNA polymerase sigma factor [Candidatus Marinimicrobia bacterium]|nr:sigma-70 family RNA polymerase sigma factor [Candidatus Neomarinimicrobiota bacterium]MDP7072512.1 sigma-70 family RNA polymerase sigma factor [Candidatus Neomarinimicrobiota bacterium]